MRKKIVLKFTAITSAFLYLISSFSLIGFAVKSQPDATVESISIQAQSGVLEGETIQLKAYVESSEPLFNGVEWSSSNPEIISCTEDGKIKGLIAGESATITCKAKWGSEKDSIKIYCVERLPNEVKSGYNSFFLLVNSQPGSYLKDICIDLVSFFLPLRNLFYVFSIISSTTPNDIFLKKVCQFAEE